ncbi:endonuclease/exonuclease/phosphatase family protein [Porifericola rhodea]|uniref:endonuclease/exonuclease/phosphatase family protein n=1 Tax=Porifericola rhodea TaxID=930972 RepID=UPI00266565AB|nr:endonuclease/exonuclease/phosphatase family protein [Porifericola rhodea]WKN30876.1 endonuclease/exonuclease/phosphatase family protein [Porifericola rhodea]
MRWKYVAVSGIIVCFLLSIHLLPHIGSPTFTQHQISGNRIKVAHFNVLGSNRHFKDIIDNSMALNADLLSFQEVDKEWALELMDGLESEYPYFAISEHEVHGVAIFSKYPVENLATYHWTGEPTLTGDILFENQRVHFVATHTLSPRSPQRYEKRNQHLSKIAEYVNHIEGPILAIGDFNAVPWSQHIVKIKQNTDLKDSRKSITSTYPSNYSLGLPIDYIFHSDELSCISFEALEAKGSDHKGVLGEYAFNSETDMLVGMN